MGQEIVIQPVSRIEGHAKVTIQLDDKGNVQDTKLQVVELRGFEKFCTGRAVEELPLITPRICGVCPWAHHLASAKATDAVFKATIPETAKMLRELAYMAHYVHSHVLHFFFLSGPDFVMGPDADYGVRNVVGIAKAAPDIAKSVVRARYVGQKMSEIVGGKALHPVAAVPGGFAKPLTGEEREQLQKMAKESLDFAVFSMDYAKKNIFPKYLDAIKTLGVINTSFLATVTKDGALNLYDGQLRMMHPDGSHEEFAPENYLDYIAEQVEPWSYLKFPYYKKAGKMVMDSDNPVGIYRVNALARMNVCDRIPTPLAQKELEEFRSLFGRPAQPTLLYHWARLIELVYAAERAIELLENPAITSGDVRVPVQPVAGRGVGVLEAPRGTLIHDYETDEKGMTKDVNLIVATAQNNAAMNMAVKKAATDLIKDGKYDQGVLNKIEMMVRSYDPCLSCATHDLSGQIALELTVLGPEGRVLDKLVNY